MKSPLYLLLARARSLSLEEMDHAQRLMEGDDYDPNESHRFDQGGDLDRRSLLEWLARESGRGSSTLEQLQFFSKAFRTLLEKGADPAQTNAVGQMPETFASDLYKRILMKARGASYEQQQSLVQLDNLCRGLLKDKKSVAQLTAREKVERFPTELLGCPLPVALAARAFNRNGWAEKAPEDPKTMLIQTAAAIRIRQLERLLKWIPTYVAPEDQAAATAVFQSAFKAALNFYGWEDDAKEAWTTAEQHLFKTPDWEAHASDAMDGRFGALTPHICYTVLLANSPCDTPERTSRWLEAMAALGRCPIDERQWLEADDHRHFIQDGMQALKKAWQPNSLLLPPPEGEQALEEWSRLLTPKQGTEVIVELMVTNTDGPNAEQFEAWEGFLKGWLNAHPEQASRIHDLAYHGVVEASQKEAMRSRMRPLALDAVLSSPTPQKRPKPRF